MVHNPPLIWAPRAYSAGESENLILEKGDIKDSDLGKMLEAGTWQNECSTLILYDRVKKST